MTETVDRGHLGSHHDWHDAQHEHEHEDGALEEDEHAPTGLLIHLPYLLAAPRCGASLASAQGLHLPVLLPKHPWSSALLERTHRHELRCSGWPPQRAARSGVAALLRSSHAILI